MPNLQDKVAIITGASAGLGKATAIEFAQLGCRHMTITGRDEAKLKEAKKEVLAAGKLKDADVLTLIADMSKEKDLENVIEKTVGHFKKLDILVNNAGHARLDNVESMDLTGLDDMLRTHIRAVTQLTKLAMPHLIKTKGNIVNVSSVLGLRPNTRGHLSYSIAKAGQDQLTRCTALEFAPHGIRVNAVNPGYVETEVYRGLEISKEDYLKYMETMKAKHALGRLGLPHEVAKSIAFLASDDASFITAVTLAVDGGYTAMEP